LLGLVFLLKCWDLELVPVPIDKRGVSMLPPPQLLNFSKLQAGGTRILFTSFNLCEKRHLTWHCGLHLYTFILK
jgi:hypothetical protein